VPQILDIDNTLTPEQLTDIRDRVGKIMRMVNDSAPSGEIREKIVETINEVFLAQRAKRQSAKLAREARKAESQRREAARSRFNV
jgi:hypothetical protein